MTLHALLTALGLREPGQRGIPSAPGELTTRQAARTVLAGRGRRTVERWLSAEERGEPIDPVVTEWLAHVEDARYEDGVVTLRIRAHG